MAKFKVGDRVVLIEKNLYDIASEAGPPLNAIGTVKEESRLPYVIWDNWYKGHNGNAMGNIGGSVWAVDEDWLELLTNKK